ncbi:rRNA-binding ribosome biosynthesis protein rpf2 [Lithohypha guttulata]|uniref:rRNA-binding ribosome biosynthesis protein rpf2 n=1 Tax=Lithohypha guttulata TaxID=1690604 RepID=UPI002DE1CD9E|nr:rRNA-binding ribosome biosynthesis protein rpf2 [Lithohypha guttulata]
MSLLREVKPRNARTAKIVKAREPQTVEGRKRILLLHGTRCPDPIRNVLKTIMTLTKPHSVQLTKKNENIHPFQDPASLEFLSQKNDCAVAVFATHSKKRPNNITILRLFDGRTLDMTELLLVTTAEELQAEDGKMQIGVEMKPMIVFAGSPWDDNSASEQASLFRQLKSTFLDVFQGEEIASIDVAGLQVRTLRSNTAKVPRVELDQIGPSFDFRVGRFKTADPNIMKEAMKHGRRPNEARNKKNIETDIVGDKLGRIHLGRQDLNELQTRKMKGLKRARDEDDDVEVNGNGVHQEEEDIVSQSDEEDGGIDLDDELVDDGSSVGGTGDEIDIGDDSAEEADTMPKRQRIA